jgi:Ca-activated chloride channel family protein
VVPPTEDPAMLDLYVPALSPALMPHDGKNAAAGLAVAEQLLVNDPAAGTIVFISDGFDEKQSSALIAEAKDIRHQLLWLAVGTENGAPIRGADGRVAMDPEGHAEMGTFDVEAIRRVAHEANIPLASLRLDDDDLTWVQRRAQAYLAQADESRRVPHWKESGYWLVMPILLLALWFFRKGWTVKWLPAVLVAISLGSMPTHAQAASWHWLDLFATHDQQGRWSFEHKDFKTAAQLFDDPMWKGRAQYLSGDYAGALETFARLRTAQSYFYIGNTLAHLDDYAGAIKSYDNALELRPGMREAAANRELIRRLLAQDKIAENDPEEEQPDQIQVDKKKGAGTQVVVAAAPRPTEDIWMRGLNTSPAVFLQQRFEQESESSAKAAP